MPDRRCAFCGKIKNRDELIKITKQNPLCTIVINPSSDIFGRSAYLCYNKSCIEGAFKKNRIAKALKTSIPTELKGKLLNEFEYTNKN